MLRNAVKVAVVPAKGIMELNITPDGNALPAGGVDGNFLKMISQMLNFDLELVFPQDKEWGRPNSDGSWTGMIGMVQRGEADMAVCNVGISEQRASAVDFSLPYTIDRTTFMVPTPGFSSRTLGFVYPFQLHVWISLLIVMTFMTLVLRYFLKAKRDTVQTALKVAGILLKQGFELGDDSCSDRILSLSWTMWAQILAFSYSAVLLSFLTVPLREPGVRTIPELVKEVREGRYECVVKEGTMQQDIFWEAKTESTKIIGNRMKLNNWVIPHGKITEEFVNKSNTAVISESSSFQYRSTSGFYASNFISPDSFVINLIGIPLKKGFCCKSRINKLIRKAIEAGLHQKFRDDQIFRVNTRLKLNQTPENNIIAISLSDLCGAFFVLCVGLAFGFIACIWEVLHFKWCLTGKDQSRGSS